MEPNKMEKDFKKKLEQRAIQPSGMAWDRLDAMLSVAEKKKSPGRTWLFVAAGFLGFLLVSTLFLKQGNNTIIQGNEQNNAVVTTQLPDGDTVNAGENIVNEDAANKDSDPVTYKKKKNTAVALQDYKKGVRQQPVVAVPQIIPAAGNERVMDEALAESHEEPEAEKVNVAAPDDLLAESFDKAIAKKSKVKVDPNALLSGVEGELDDNYRGNVWQTVTKNYNAVKTTLANRNRE